MRGIRWMGRGEWVRDSLPPPWLSLLAVTGRRRKKNKINGIEIKGQRSTTTKKNSNLAP